MLQRTLWPRRSKKTEERDLYFKRIQGSVPGWVILYNIARTVETSRPKGHFFFFFALFVLFCPLFDRAGLQSLSEACFPVTPLTTNLSFALWHSSTTWESWNYLKVMPLLDDRWTFADSIHLILRKALLLVRFKRQLVFWSLYWWWLACSPWKTLSHLQQPVDNDLFAPELHSDNQKAEEVH